MMNSVHNQFAKMFGSIEDSTVYREVLELKGSRIVVRWSGSQKDLVEKRAARAVAEFGEGASVGEAFNHKDGWAVDQTIRQSQKEPSCQAYPQTASQ